MIGDYRNSKKRKHLVVYVLQDGTVRLGRSKRRDASRIVQNRPKDSQFVGTFYPKLRLWRFYVVRDFVLNPGVGQFYRAPPPCAKHRRLKPAIVAAQLLRS